MQVLSRWQPCFGQTTKHVSRYLHALPLVPLDISLLSLFLVGRRGSEMLALRVTLSVELPGRVRLFMISRRDNTADPSWPFLGRQGTIKRLTGYLLLL
jgi:hypothetical protein